jgi:hypothetical protein
MKQHDLGGEGSVLVANATRTVGIQHLHTRANKPQLRSGAERQLRPRLGIGKLQMIMIMIHVGLAGESAAGLTPTESYNVKYKGTCLGPEWARNEMNRRPGGT